MTVGAKICGLSDLAGVDAAIAGGAAMVGFVFYPPSPRHLEPAGAAPLAARASGAAERVGLFVDPDDAQLEATLKTVDLDWIQLHGAETPTRAAAIRTRFDKPVMKALRVRSAADVAAAGDYAGLVDRLLFDAPPPDRADALPGGNGEAFDWRLLKGADVATPWMLAGGLTPDTVAAAIAESGATMVDVSSGVESAPGVKDTGMIQAFLTATRAAGPRDAA
ncbi:MAG: phosphoribosylanthranilate isomerase [Pseudomonadota bacterium]